jgi:hypothetical protein
MSLPDGRVLLLESALDASFGVAVDGDPGADAGTEAGPEPDAGAWVADVDETAVVVVAPSAISSAIALTL